MIPDGPVLAVVLVTSVLAGLARGFSGFGAALIFMPVASAALGPRLAAPLMLIVDTVAASGLLPNAWRMADRREVGPMFAGAIVGIPCGTLALSRLDPTSVRWVIAGLVIGMLCLLISGWRRHTRPATGAIAGTGLVAGFFSGVAQMSGPVVMGFWLGGAIPGPLVRANAVLYFAASSMVTIASYLVAGLFTAQAVVLAALTCPAYAAGLFAGSRLFGHASDALFRRICYALVALAAVISLPVLDRFLR